MNKRYLIAGAGIAGLSAAEAVREADPSGVIIMFSAEDCLPYSRPMLTKAPLSSFNPGGFIIHERSWFAEKNIALRLSDPVTSVDAVKKTVTALSGTYGYDKLIIASGAENFIPPFPGADRDMVRAIRRTEDIFGIKRSCGPGSRAVIIGGGVIGIEAALQLYRSGAEVTVLEAMPHLMAKQIDREISDLICRELDGIIKIHTGAVISSIEEDSVILSDGQKFCCDIVIISCGVRSSVSVAPPSVKAAGSIQIDEHCLTSDPDIYAAGDCAARDGINYALWSQAMAQGRTAGLNAASSDNRHVIEPFDTSLVINSPYLSLFAAGDPGRKEDREYETRYLSAREEDKTFYVNQSQGKRFEKLYYLDGRLTGAAVIGNLSHMEKLKEEILGIRPAVRKETGV